MKRIFIAFPLLVLLACTEQQKPTQSGVTNEPPEPKTISDPPELTTGIEPVPSDFVDIAEFVPGIILDIRYATSNNFTGEQIYDCPACLLRPEAAKAILKAQEILRAKGLGLKMFDCYRPRPYQQRLWDKVPDPNYVTPPNKGSMHSRGAAVDLTITELSTGRDLDMGTGYDFFGVEAHSDYTGHSAAILENRQLLRKTMEAVGFRGIRTEWWHFSYRGKRYELSDYVWECK